MRRSIANWLGRVAVALAILGAVAPQARADERLCDASFEDCRAPLIQLIQNETVGLDVAFWFMQDARYSTEIIKRWQAGVPVRVIVDPRANPTYPGNSDVLNALATAGIPMRYRTASGILHWKMMLFAGQNVVEFSGANYSPTAFVPQSPYSDYEDEVPYFSDDPAVVNSFRTKYDDLWLDTAKYANYANIVEPRTRVYPIFTKDPALNFPETEDYYNRISKRYTAETRKIDVIMYRITDERHTNAMIAAEQRGVPVRIISDMFEYRNPTRQWVSYNMDRLWAAGIPIRVRAHAGLNHQKLVLLYGQGMSVSGSSNWTTPSANQQQEHNYFTTKPWMFQWFVDHFERKWNNLAPNGAIETDWFTPLPPDKPVSSSPANASTITAGTTVTLKWNGGHWAHLYDIYFGVDPNPPLFAADVRLGPVDPDRPKVIQQFKLPTLQPGTTYYWRIVSKTMAGLSARGPTWSFTTTGTPPPPPPPPPDATTVTIWANDVPSTSVYGLWQFITDPTAVGGTALYNPDKGKAKVSPALATPVNYFEVTFDAVAGVPYHLWARMRAYNNSLSNDSLNIQFSESQDAFGSPMYRIGTTSAAEMILQEGPSSSALSGWGWEDNGFGTFGPDVYFATSGPHTLRVQQRTDGVVVDQIVLSPDTYVRTAPGLPRNDTTRFGSSVSGATAPAAPYLPDGWSQATVGIVGINGWGSYEPSLDTWSIIASGGDIWGTKDGMQFLYRPLTGDGSVVARVTGVPNTSAWARAGVMIRESLDANARYGYMFFSAGRVLGFQRRLAPGGVTWGTAGVSGYAPQWVRLDRAGDTLTGYQSSDGVNWSYVGSDTVSMAAPTVYIGLAATSALVTRTALTTLEQVRVTTGTPVAPVPPPATPPLPSGWSTLDIGNVGYTGSATFTDSTGMFAVTGAGADIWGSVDAFRYVYRLLIGDGTIVARVRSVQNISSSTKAGVMIRQSLDPGAANVYMAVTRGKGTTFQYRVSAGATTAVSGGANVAPYWVKLERAGDMFTAYQSADGVTWTLVGSQTIPMGSGVYIGLAVTSHSAMSTATASFDGVAVP